MTLKQISKALLCENHVMGTEFNLEPIENVAASDLMSEVLIAEEENLILITALNTEQTIRTAHIVDAIGIILVNGKKPQPGMIKLSEEFGLSLISTKNGMFETCAKVHSLLSKK